MRRAVNMIHIFIKFYKIKFGKCFVNKIREVQKSALGRSHGSDIYIYIRHYLKILIIYQG